MEELNVSIEVTKDFKYAYGGVRVVEYKAGETPTVSAECATLARQQKWAKPERAAKKDTGPAPENKDAAPESAPLLETKAAEAEPATVPAPAPDTAGA